jgi:conjugal transfer pilus assembly protein TraF
MRTSLIAFVGALIIAAPGFAQQAPETGNAPIEAALPTPADAAQAPVADQVGDLYCRRKLGTWFYCDKPKAASKAQQLPAAPSQSATERLKEITAQLDEYKARAVLEPTTENIAAYITYQRQQLDRASTFADVWQRAIWQNPGLDYTLQRPVSTVAKRAWIDNRSADRSGVMQRIGQRYGIFYFYAQSCGACEIQAPILKSVTDMNGLHVQAVSMDGGPNRVFPNYFVDSGQSARMGLTSRATPSLVLFDTLTKRPIPIGTGLMAADEIMERIFTLTNVKPGSDF